jgi:acyl dehydratase
LLTTSVKFSRPVYAGDELKITGTIVEKNDALKLLKVQVVMENQHAEKVLRGDYMAKVTAGEDLEVS